jgi:hypothetical protein
MTLAPCGQRLSQSDKIATRTLQQPSEFQPTGHFRAGAGRWRQVESG